MPLRRSSALRITFLAAAATLAAAGCGSESNADEKGAEPLGQELGGSVAFLAQCSDWVEGTQDEKLATIEEVRSQVNREDLGVTASELSDDQAMKVFDNGCSRPYASGYRLHIMYARAAAFEPLREIVDGETEPPTP